MIAIKRSGCATHVMFGNEGALPPQTPPGYFRPEDDTGSAVARGDVLGPGHGTYSD